MNLEPCARGMGTDVMPIGGMNRPVVPIRVNQRTVSPAGFRYSCVSQASGIPGAHIHSRARRLFSATVTASR